MGLSVLYIVQIGPYFDINPLQTYRPICVLTVTYWKFVAIFVLHVRQYVLGFMQIASDLDIAPIYTYPTI